MNDVVIFFYYIKVMTKLLKMEHINEIVNILEDPSLNGPNDSSEIIQRDNNIRWAIFLTMLSAFTPFPYKLYIFIPILSFTIYYTCKNITYDEL